MTRLNFPGRPVIIKLTVPEVQAKFERQRMGLEAEARLNGEREPLTNEMFVAYLLDIRKAALDMKSISVQDNGRDIVDEHAMEILGHDDPTPRGELNLG